jgi:tripartite-type tricarboxylate transporter receptor subunit TctC
LVARGLGWAAFALAGTLHLLPVAAEEYPSRPIKVIVPFPAGGTADILPRMVAEKLSARWGQPMIVDNRPGAAGNIGAEAVAKAEADGYTLLASPPPPLVVNQSLYPNLPYDASQFVPITIIAAVPSVLVVHPQLPVSDLQSFIGYARAHPGKLNYASQGSGTTSHLTTELMKSMADLKIIHVPYKGSAPALTDLLAGQVDMMFDNLGSSLQHIRSGKLRALAVGSEKRVAALPDVPAMDEMLRGFVSIAWFGLVGPPRMSPNIAAKIQQAIAEAIRLPDVRGRFADMSAESMGTTPAQTAAFMRQEAERWRQVIRVAGVRVE